MKKTYTYIPTAENIIVSKGYPNHYNAWHESEYYPDYYNMWRESEYYEVNVSVILLYVHKRCISMYIVNVILN